MESKPSTNIRAFPRNGGDALLILSDRRRYVLRAAQLRDFSGLFKRLLKGKGANLSQEGERRGIRFCLALSNYDEHGNEIYPEWRRIELNPEGDPLRALSVIDEEEEYNIPSQLWHSYNMLLAIIYQLDLKMNMRSIATIVEDCVGLVELAEYLGSMHIVTREVESALMSQGQALYRAIAIKPLTWIDLGHRLSSGIIFKEALIHLTGRYDHFDRVKPTAKGLEYNPGARSLLDILPSSVKQVLEQKRQKLLEMCQVTEKAMISYYPPNLAREQVTGRADRDNIGRQSYASDIFCWMALAVFRHWLGQSLVEDEGRGAEDGGFAFYNSVAEMNYLGREQVAGFHGRFPMSSKGKSVVENHLSGIKEAMREIVEPLFAKKCQYMDDTDGVVKWLTCTDVTPADYPWTKEDEATSQRRVKHEHGQHHMPAASDEDDDNEIEPDMPDVEMHEEYSREREGSSERNVARHQRPHHSDQRCNGIDYDNDGADSDTDGLRDHWRNARDAPLPEGYANDYEQTAPWEDFEWREEQRQNRIASGRRPISEHSSDEENGYDRHRLRTEPYPGWESEDVEEGANVEDEDEELEEEGFAGSDKPGWLDGYGDEDMEGGV